MLKSGKGATKKAMELAAYARHTNNTGHGYGANQIVYSTLQNFNNGVQGSLITNEEDSQVDIRISGQKTDDHLSQTMNE